MGFCVCGICYRKLMEFMGVLFHFHVCVHDADVSSESCSAPFVRNLVVDEERVRSGHWLESRLCFCQCSDTDDIWALQSSLRKNL